MDEYSKKKDSGDAPKISPTTQPPTPMPGTTHKEINMQ